MPDFFSLCGNSAIALASNRTWDLRQGFVMVQVDEIGERKGEILGAASDSQVRDSGASAVLL